MLNVIDIKAVSAVAKSHGLMLAVDNTFATPYLQNPIDLGADIVMHSVTKYIGGHSDIVMGALMLNDDAFRAAYFCKILWCRPRPGIAFYA